MSELSLVELFRLHADLNKDAEQDRRNKLSPQCRLLLSQLEAGKRLTPLISAYEFGVMALSQRMGDLRRAGYPICARMVKLPSGKRVAEYSMAREVA